MGQLYDPGIIIEELSLLHLLTSFNNLYIVSQSCYHIIGNTSFLLNKRHSDL